MIAGLFGKLALVCIALGLVAWGISRLIKAGRDGERAKNAEALTSTLEKANAAENAVRAAGDDDLERMRNRWTR